MSKQNVTTPSAEAVSPGSIETEGSPLPLGATWSEEEQSFNFALFSRYATGVTLLLYSDADVRSPLLEYRFDYLKNETGRVWHCCIPRAQAPAAKYYAYRVAGPFAPANGKRFDQQKVLLDPYAKAVFFPADFSRDVASHPGPNDGYAALGVLPACDEFDWGQTPRPRHTHDTVIYELHVKGFTEGENSGVSPESRGTYAGIVEKIPYLVELGVTAVELMPVHQFDPQEGNYWGYMTLNFFAPHEGYSSAKKPGEQIREFRSMVKSLHAAGIEVLLDVVYSHTTEGGETGPTYSFRGIDNQTYYLLGPDGQYRDDADTGNVLSSADVAGRHLVVNSLAYWVKEMRVDGFRFDLATIFTRDENDRINLVDPPIISEITALEEVRNVRMIAEAWDAGSYQLGHSFPGITWLQWNGRFRDDVRTFIKGDPGKVGPLMARIYGSDDLFPDTLLDAYHPYQSVNYIDSHDGFCLYDLVAYDQKHNEANGHGNKDGRDINRSWNCGWEGDVDVPAEVVALRKRQIKNFCCILFLSNGTPMFRAGDEFMNTQSGNNNPYNQDNATSWLDWDLRSKNDDIFRFFKKMIAFRKTHRSLGRSRFWREDVKWYGVGANVDFSYDSHSIAFCLHGASLGDADIYVMINSYWKGLLFRLQEGVPNDWVRVADTSLPSPQDFAETDKATPMSSAEYAVKARSIAIFTRKK